MNGCEMMRCTDYRDGMCGIDGLCKYRVDDSVDSLTAERDRYKAERDELINCGGNIIAKCERCCNDRHCLTCHLVQDWEHLINRIREKP